MFFDRQKLIDVTRTLSGRPSPVVDPTLPHRVLGLPIGEVPAQAEVAYFALGCFWGAERLFWQIPGVLTTAVGYQGGHAPNPTYEQVCSGQTGHAETVRVVFDPRQVDYDQLLTVFFENHDPTQGMRQGNDRGSQYRSAVYATTEQQETAARAAQERMQQALTRAGYGPITTEIAPAGPFFFAEAYHQQYLDANPGGYCPVHATGVNCG